MECQSCVRLEGWDRVGDMPVLTLFEWELMRANDLRFRVEDVKPYRRSSSVDSAVGPGLGVSPTEDQYNNIKLKDLPNQVLTPVNLQPIHLPIQPPILPLHTIFVYPTWH